MSNTNEDISESNVNGAAGTVKRRLVFRLTSLLFAIVAAMVAGEITVRVYVASRGWTANCYVCGVTLLIPDSESGYTLATNHRFQSGVLKISTNSHGLRGPDIRTEQPSNTRRVALVRGSSVFGYLVNDGEEAARLLETRLTELSQGSVEHSQCRRSGLQRDSKSA